MPTHQPAAPPGAPPANRQPARPRGHVAAVWGWALGVFAVGLISSALLALAQREHNASTANAALTAALDSTTRQILARVRLYQYGLRGARGAVLAAGEAQLNQATFRRYSESRDTQAEFPGARGFGFIRRVPVADTPAFLAAARARGTADFKLRQLAAHAGERYVIEFIEPLSRNAPALGLDIASEANRKRAADAALASGAATLTGPITLVQVAGDRQQSFLFLLPVYRGGATPPTPAQRAADGVGWSYAPLNMNEVLAGLVDPARLHLQLRDVSAPGEAEIFYSTPGTPANVDDLPPQSRTHAVYGRRWQLTLAAQPAFVAALGLRQPLAVMAGGSAASALLALLAYAAAAAGRRRREGVLVQTRLAAIVESANDAIIGKTLDGVVTSWNHAAETILGYRESDAIGQTVNSLIVPTARQNEETAILASIRRGEAVPHFESLRQHRDGHLIDVSITVSPIRDEAGAIVGAAKTLRDITHQKANQQRLLELNANLEAEVTARTAELEGARHALQAVLDAVPSMIGYWDKHLVNHFANHAYKDWFGVDPASVPGMHIHALLGDALFELNYPYMQAVLRGEAQTFERTMPARAGVPSRHALYHYLPDSVDGEVRGFFVVIHDVTELNRVSALLGNVLAAASELSIIATDPDGTIRVFNRGAERMLGYRADALIGRATPALIHLASEVGARGAALSAEYGEPIAGFRAFVHVAERQGSETRQWTYVRRDGSTLPVSLVVTAMRDAAGTITGYLGIAEDITERLRASALLQQAKDDAEAANAAKSAFLANLSHEIRTPMNAVIGVAHLLDASPLDADQRQLIASLKVAGTTLMGLINDVLDLAKIEAGEMRLETLNFAPADVLTEITTLFAPQAEARGVAFRVRGLDRLPQRIAGDPLRLRQVLTNLVSNALKFTDAGSVVIEVACAAPQANPTSITLAVRDTGCGIAADAQARLFAPFTQADASTTRHYGGTGLGLSIVRRLAALMGGEVGVDSAPGLGSRFWVRLPFAQPDPACAAASPRTNAGAVAAGQRLRGVRVLLVDDSRINRDVGCRLLELDGATVVSCPDGQTALDVLLARAADFDVVLMDIQMPEMDGYATTRALRDDPALARLPVLALTAGALAGDEARARAAGMDGFLTKPLDPATLAAAILQALPQDRARAATPPSPAPRPQEQSPERPPEPRPSPSGSDPAWPAIAGVELDRVRQQYGFEADFYYAQIAVLIDDYRKVADLPAMQSLLADEPRTLISTMHRLRAAAGLLGASAIQQQAGEIEAALLAILPLDATAETAAARARIEAGLAVLAQRFAELIVAALAALRARPG